MVYVWLGLIVAFIAVEAATVNLVSIWFIGGAVAGLVCAILGVPALLQWTVFIAVSAGLLASSPRKQTPTVWSGRRRLSQSKSIISARRARFA